MKFAKNRFVLITTALLLVALLAACKSGSTGGATASGTGSSADTQSPSGSPSGAGDVKVLKVAYELEGTPFTYQAEDGTDTGGDVELFRIVDEYLTGYDFEFIGTSDDDVVVGLTTGSYDIGLTNAFYTKERGESYLVPTENMGGNLLGLVVRKENADVKTFADIAAQGLKVSPLIVGNGITFQFEQYNEQNPDAAIEIEYSTDMSVWTKQYGWLVDGKYDVVPTLQVSWDAGIVAEDGVNHGLYDQLAFNMIKPVKAYALVSKVTQDEAFIKELDAALAKAKADPRAAETSKEFYGVNIFDYPFEQGW